jgi:sRNA-binding regulator protein Hfq
MPEKLSMTNNITADNYIEYHAKNGDTMCIFMQNGIKLQGSIISMNKEGILLESKNFPDTYVFRDKIISIIKAF